MTKPLALTIALFTLMNSSAFAKKKSVTILEAKKEEIQKVLLFPARIVPGKMSQVISEFPSVVEKITVSLGDSVAPKQQLFQLKHSDPLYNERRLNVFSPINGKVVKILVSEGSQIARGEKLLTIASMKGEKILIEIPAKDLSSIEKGQKGKLNVDGKEYNVVVAGVSPLVDSASGTASAEVNFDEAEDARPMGVLGKVTLTAQKHEGFLIPEHAISYQGKDTFLKIVNDLKISKVKVTLGDRIRDRVEVATGLKEGELVVERASGYLADGAEVEVQNPPTAQKSEGK